MDDANHIDLMVNEKPTIVVDNPIMVSSSLHVPILVLLIWEIKKLLF